MRRRERCNTPYLSRIPGHRSQYKMSYTLCKYKNIPYMTSYLMAVNFWNSLVSSEVVPTSQPARNPCSISWRTMKYPRRWLRITTKLLQITSLSLIPQNFPPPFGISTTTCQVASSAILPVQKAVWINFTNFRQIDMSGVFVSVSFYIAIYVSDLLDSSIHLLRCSSHTTKGTPERLEWIRFTVLLIHNGVIYHEYLRWYQDSLSQGWYSLV